MSLSRRFRVWLVIAAALVVALVLGARAIRPAVPRVAVARVRSGALESWITTNGVIEPSDPHGIHAPVTGFIKTMGVDEGQKVKRGTPLLTLDVAQQRADLARAREDMARALNALRVLHAGGPVTERAQVDSDLRKTDAEIAEGGDRAARSEASCHPRRAHADGARADPRGSDA